MFRTALTTLLVCFPMIAANSQEPPANKEWMVYPVNGTIKRDQAKDLESWINTKCKPDNWGDFWGFTRQSGPQAATAVLCFPGNGGVGDISVTFQFMDADPEHFRRDAMAGRRHAAVLGFYNGEEVSYRNYVYLAVPKYSQK